MPAHEAVRTRMGRKTKTIWPQMKIENDGGWQEGVRRMRIRRTKGTT